MSVRASDFGTAHAGVAPDNDVGSVIRRARHLGLAAAVGCSLLIGAYASTLVLGIRSLATPLKPIGDPFFTVLEILIIAIAPMIVVLMGAIHAWAPMEAKAGSLLALVFAGLLAVVTCSVHFVILTVGRHAAAAGIIGLPFLLSFTWPSVAYALDILAWDVFFAVAVLFAAPTFSGSVLARWIRALLVASGALALGGLTGIAGGDFRLRMIGVVGYAGVFPVATVLIAILFRRATPRES